MEVQSDVYVQFTGDNSEESWDLTGDSDDAGHVYWQELRDCNFGIKRRNPGSGDGKGGVDEKGGSTELDEIRFTKRVDFASAKLFHKCCAAKMKVDEAQEKGLPKPKIKMIRVEVCRSAAGVKFPYIIIEYFDVLVTHYEVKMDGPEPTETLTLEAEKFRYGFRPTNRFTGEPKTPYDPEHPSDADVQWADCIAKKAETDGGGSGAQEDEHGSSTDGGAAPAASNVGITIGPAGGAGASGNGALPAVASATDGAVRSNFPGLRDEDGFGLLPD